jgi:protein ImuB
MRDASTTWLAIVLPRLKTDRLIRSGQAPEGRPLAVYAKEANAFLLTGVDARASALGLKLAMSLADARAIHPALAAVEAEPDEDARALDNIAAWCERFTPVVVVDPPNGLFLDISGCAHLFGGEAALRDQIVARLNAQGFAARAALAPTPGAAWAFARYARNPTLSLAERVAAKRPGEGRSNAQAPVCLNAPHPLTPSPQGRGGDALVRETLAPLPIEALRLEEASAALLRRLGLKTIGQLLAAPRSSFTARAGERAMLRLDQALGRAPEALTPRRPAPPVFALRRFLEPLFNVETILIATEHLCGDIIEKLDIRGAGARRAELHLFGVDGRDRTITIGVSRPEREVKALLRLFREKLNLAAENLDAEFGIEAARLDVVQLQRIEGAPRTLVAVEETQASVENIAALVDILSARLGPKRVLRPRFNDVHQPEKAGSWNAALTSPSMGEVAAKRPEGVWAQPVKKTPQEAMPGPPSGLTPSVTLRVTAPPSRGSRSDGVMRRPLTVFQRAQPIEAIATVPDGPPIRFRWRRVLREVVRAEGPERISGDWLGGAPTRDYYRVEDKDGRRYWLYREGLYGENEEIPCWFVHGLFA